MNKFLSAAVFTVAALGFSTQAMAEETVPENFGAAACLIQKGESFIVTENRFGELSVPMKKLHPEVRSAAEEVGVKTHDAADLARFVAKFGAHEELGLPMESIQVQELVNISKNKKGDTLLMFKCATDASPNMAEVKSPNAKGIVIVNPATMKDESGKDTPKFRIEADRNVLLGLISK